MTVATNSSSFDRVRVLFPDHLGLARGKYLPGAIAHKGTKHCIALFALDYDRAMTPAPGTMVLEGLPDVDVSFDPADVRASWEDDRTGVVVGDVSMHDEPLAISPRHVLRQAISRWKGMGLNPKVGIELEAFIMQPNGHGGWEEWDTPTAYVYGTGPAVDPAGIIDDIMFAALAADLRVESINSEYDTPQFELTLEYGDALEAVDRIFLFKVLARELAQRKGLLLTFMGKPFANKGGSGLHVNFSAEDSHGVNVFLDTSDDAQLSKIARHAIAGCLAHHEAMAAVCAPTVNAYKRLVPGQMSGYFANWGVDHRSATVRIPWGPTPGKRIEHRMSDGAANPYLATAAVLNAAYLGVANELALDAPEVGDGFETANTQRCVPENLSGALDAYESNGEFAAIMGHAFSDYWVAIKRAEWDKYRRAVTDWELNHYLPFL